MYRINLCYIINKDGSRYEFYLVFCNGRQATSQFETWEDADQWIQKEKEGGMG